jgi:uncharacterized membrane protein
MSPRAPDEAGPASRALDATRAVLLSPLGIGCFTVACLIAADVRRFAQVEPGYGFYRWNLFLALVPLALAYLVSRAARHEITWPALPVLGLAWLIFLPNAPYLVTDLVHLDEGVNGPNIIVLSLLAVTGLLIGVKSIQLVQGTVERLFGLAAGRMAVHAIAVLTAFGIYLGRVKRWNSWDVIEEPRAFVHALLRVPSQPGRVLLAMAATVAFAMAFSLAYRVLAGPGARGGRLAPTGTGSSAER